MKSSAKSESGLSLSHLRHATTVAGFASEDDPGCQRKFSLPPMTINVVFFDGETCCGYVALVSVAVLVLIV